MGTVGEEKYSVVTSIRSHLKHIFLHSLFYLLKCLYQFYYGSRKETFQRSSNHDQKRNIAASSFRKEKQNVCLQHKSLPLWWNVHKLKGLWCRYIIDLFLSKTKRDSLNHFCPNFPKTTLENNNISYVYSCCPLPYCLH